MSQRISIFELSEQALDETLDKYSGALRGYGLTWTRCKICTEVENIAAEESGNWSEQSPCKLFCPLYPSEWCRDEKLESRLYDGYSAMLTALFNESEQNRWEIDVNNYLWWITIELELMRTKCQLPMTEVIGLRLRKKSGHDGHID